MLYTDLIKQSQLTESAAQELDEISLDQIGRGIGSASDSVSGSELEAEAELTIKMPM